MYISWLIKTKMVVDEDDEDCGAKDQITLLCQET